jgi:hypothetical protein
MLRRGRFIVVDQSVAGDAPKDFIRVYEYGVGRRASPRTWPAYIAKIGHKWYPAESITEQLMTRIGQLLGIRVAESRLMFGDQHIRFLSRYFLEKDEILYHGAQVISGYLEDDKFVSDVGAEKAESDIFTFQVIRTAIESVFPGQKQEILGDLVRMIAFDALVGNQDRHLYNWGVVVHPKGIRPPFFSPIYDTARGLFWNTSEAGLARFANPVSLEKYMQEARPLIGWENMAKLNHFRLIENIAMSDLSLHTTLCQIDTAGRLPQINAMIDEEFAELLSAERRSIIQRCLAWRFERFREVLK